MSKLFEESLEFCLFIFLSLVRHKDLAEMMSKWSDCAKETYTEKVLVEAAQKAAEDLTRKYHIRSFMHYYFDGLRCYDTVLNRSVEYPREIYAIRHAFMNLPINGILRNEDKLLLISIEEKYFDDDEVFMENGIPQ